MAPFGTIWSYMPSARVSKIQAVANLNGLELDIPPNFVLYKDNLTEEYLSKFPLGKVPGFEGADGARLVESDAIAQYVAESGPLSEQLLGSTPLERASIRSWISFSDHAFLRPLRELAMWRFGQWEYDEEKETTQLALLERGLAYMEGQLEGKTWLGMNEKLSLGDITVAAPLHMAFSLIIDKEMRDKYPSIVAWYERVMAVEEVARAMGEVKFIEKRQVNQGKTDADA
ncbi:uncharacterized protein N7484_004825 [Penicillium longicatenatum]|uniref:uncharacterized protein n=1 Tax=Penicillium longicatenatum TaxID=1561947 RepID=UPI0025489638|nr:uncharacterized protein N7484_004825 [Penicillium longicatenatum]KAJ5651102.1 hypothetical protein N7484_004825 [Penicillium longicatenatum]